ncbi:hypothetical protein CONPUDRAFT_77732 [Coniophora puteana RWD-64-598 SS2]|uniref:Uncharacterized protein n=1 Tax=Coniophora puteana (strain RWD-64-598) TaxID=741705 RepID=A0A5M3M7V6_CONPW|nr:uncharacterized protein CONPUDRAFT_77732 [Coniophora puteana RWD-64-598 SS2]EIW74944.1 hypothetical protein CONPUDRAFT_77732 [Coniophora puteana RWD-64-598 SS2]
MYLLLCINQSPALIPIALRAAFWGYNLPFTALPKDVQLHLPLFPAMNAGLTLAELNSVDEDVINRVLKAMPVCRQISGKPDLGYIWNSVTIVAERAITLPVTVLYVMTVAFAFTTDISNAILTKVLELRSGVCVMQPIPVSFLIFSYTSIPKFILDVVFVTLIGFKTTTYYMQALNKKWSGAILMKTLGQGAFLCYLSICLTILLLMLLPLLAPEFFFIAESVLFSLFAMTVNRLVLGMNKANLRGLNDFTSQHSHEVDIAFAMSTSFTLT